MTDAQAPAPDREAARTFLRYLDPSSEEFVFQTFDDSKTRRNRALARTLYGTLDQCSPTLVSLSRQGAGIFVCINKTDSTGKRATENVILVRSHFVDFDDVRPEAIKESLVRFALKPHLMVESSPGKWHFYWLVVAAQLGGFSETQERLAAVLGSDPRVKDLPRVMRLPGFPHQKDGCAPSIVRIIFTHDGPHYTSADFQAALATAEKQGKPPTKERRSVTGKLAAGLRRPPDMRKGYPNGQRTGELTRRAGWCLGRERMSVSEATEACLAWNLHNMPPLAVEKVRDTVASIAKSEAKKAEADRHLVEPPRPLMRELPPAGAFPVDALGPVLAPAARAIHDRVRAPLAICGQSVLAAATLAVQGHANIRLPTGHEKPLSNYFVSVAATGERKSAVDQEALWPVRKREAALREAYADDRLKYENDKDAWEVARKAASKNAKGDRARTKAALDALGPAPYQPLEPIMTCGEPTYEGACKLLAVGRPSIGIFAAEGGQFIGGHGMNDDAKLRTASGLSALWDGEPIKRIRALDGFMVLPGRRVTLHLMAQPDVAAIWFGDRLLEAQGFLSRALVTEPAPASGDRIWREPAPESDASLKRYYARLLGILERPFPLALQSRNELAPRSVPLSREATAHWVRFHDHVERRIRTGGELEPVRGLANKLPEHAARIAAVLALVDNIEAGEVGSGEMEAGIALAEHYVAEALRLFGASRISGDLREAEQLRQWLLTSWREPVVSLPDIYQRGPNAIRDKTRARRAVNILSDHGSLVAAPAGVVAGTFRREVWRIVKG